MSKIICGDCLDVMRGLDSNSIDMILTDPPYGVAYKSHKQNYDTRGAKAVKKDRPEYFEQIKGDAEVPTAWLPEAYRVLKDNTALYIFCHWSKWHILYPAVAAAGFSIKNMIVLNKSNHGCGDLLSYAPKYELLMFAVKGKHVLHFPVKRMNNVWDVSVKYSGAKRFHPNEKPVSWLLPCIEISTAVGGLVLDPFAGSGSTGVACQQLGRNFILVEMDEGFCEISRTRTKNPA